MANNCTVELIGNLGTAPATFRNDKGEFVSLSLATTGSYKDDESGAWKQQASVWHTVLVFSPTVKGYAKSFKKGDRVKITGTLSYRKTTAEIDGKKQHFTDAAVIASRIQDARLPKKGE